MKQFLSLRPQMKATPLFLLIVIFLTGCKVKPEACYTIDKPRQDLHAKVPVQFTSCSDNAEKLRWSFGDGKEEEGVQIEHVFLLPGRYQVSLTAVNGDRSDQIMETLTVLP